MNESLDRMMYTFVVEDVLKGFFVYVPPGYVACVYDLGRGVLKKCLLPGLHLKVPFWQRAKLFNTQTLEYRLVKDFNPKNVRALGDVPVSAISADGKPVNIEGTILLKLDVADVLVDVPLPEKLPVKIVPPVTTAATMIAIIIKIPMAFVFMCCFLLEKLLALRAEVAAPPANFYS